MFVGHFDLSRPLLWTVPDVLGAAECRALIDRAEGEPWLESTVNSHQGRITRREIRDNHVALLEDPALAERLLERLRPHLPETMKGCPLLCVGPKLRCYRYQQGQRFGLHHDQFYRGPDHDGQEVWSHLTLLVYLNEDFDGGETDFPHQGECIRPATGAALLFQHMLLHEGRPVTRGVKYVLRTDVFYRGALELGGGKRGLAEG